MKGRALLLALAILPGCFAAKKLPGIGDSICGALDGPTKYVLGTIAPALSSLVGVLPPEVAARYHSALDALHVANSLLSGLCSGGASEEARARAAEDGAEAVRKLARLYLEQHQAGTRALPGPQDPEAVLAAERLIAEMDVLQARLALDRAKRAAK